MSLTDGIDVTPQFTISTIQFHNEIVNTVITSLLTTLVIANLGSVINRLVFLTHRDVFSYRSFARSYVFLNSDDPLRLWGWLRGRYEFRTTDESPPRHRIVRRRLLAPLFARACILVVGIGSIALALPSEKRLDGCSRGDYSVVLLPLTERPVVNKLELMEVCAEIPLRSRLGSVRSSASYCSFRMNPGDAALMANITSTAAEMETSYIVAMHVNSSGMLISMIISGNRIQVLGSFVRWKTEDGRSFNSLVTSWNGEQHLDVIAKGVAFGTDQECNVESISSANSGDDPFFVGQVDCAFDANVADRYVSASLRESLRFRKQDALAPRAQLTNGSTYDVGQTCVVDVSVTRPLINVVPLAVGLFVAFCLNVAILMIVSRRGNAMDSAFHLVREVLGHDTSANPLQLSFAADNVENVRLQTYVCADGVSCHVGFVRGLGDTVVEGFHDTRRVGRCLQVACRGPRFVSGLSQKGAA